MYRPYINVSTYVAEFEVEEWDINEARERQDGWLISDVTDATDDADDAAAD